MITYLGFSVVDSTIFKFEFNPIKYLSYLNLKRIKTSFKEFAVKLK